MRIRLFALMYGAARCGFLHEREVEVPNALYRASPVERRSLVHQAVELRAVEERPVVARALVRDLTPVEQDVDEVLRIRIVGLPAECQPCRSCRLLVAGTGEQLRGRHRLGLRLEADLLEVVPHDLATVDVRLRVPVEDADRRDVGDVTCDGLRLGDVRARVGVEVVRLDEAGHCRRQDLARYDGHRTCRQREPVPAGRSPS